MLDLVLKNGRIVDGTGNPWFFGNVGIKGDMIVDVGMVSQEGLETIDVRDQVISPGFIDGHCHSDLMILDNPRSEIKLQQTAARGDQRGARKLRDDAGAFRTTEPGAAPQLRGAGLG